MLLLHGGLLGVDGFADTDGLEGTEGQSSETTRAGNRAQLPVKGEHRNG